MTRASGEPFKDCAAGERPSGPSQQPSEVPGMMTIGPMGLTMGGNLHEWGMTPITIGYFMVIPCYSIILHHVSADFPVENFLVLASSVTLTLLTRIRET